MDTASLLQQKTYRFVLCAGTLSDYQFMRRHTGSTKRAEKAKEAWGASLSSLQDVYNVFTKYTSGANSLPPLPVQQYMPDLPGLMCFVLEHAPLLSGQSVRASMGSACSP